MGTAVTATDRDATTHGESTRDVGVLTTPTTGQQHSATNPREERLLVDSAAIAAQEPEFAAIAAICSCGGGSYTSTNASGNRDATTARPGSRV